MGLLFDKFMIVNARLCWITGAADLKTNTTSHASDVVAHVVIAHATRSQNVGAVIAVRLCVCVWKMTAHLFPSVLIFRFDQQFVCAHASLVAELPREV